MHDLTFHFDDHVTRVELDAPLLSAGRLGICLLQLPASVTAIDGDRSRQLAVAALRDLFVGGPLHSTAALKRMMAGAGPIVVVAPEYAFGSCDWGAVDELVRAMERPLVLFAGFGATSGSAILDWQTAGSGGTRRHLAWHQGDTPISDIQRVNGGWCWLHAPGASTHCVVYLKNVLEQSTEAVDLPDLQGGRTILHLAFRDVDVFPLICADMLQLAPQDAGSPQGRIIRALGSTDADRPTLVIGSLLQHGFNVNWVAAVNSLLNTVLAGRRGAVALCNVAADYPDADEAHDKWRSLSGFYVPYDALPKGQADLPAVRALSDVGIVGAVVRATEACATTGFAAWGPFTPVRGKFAWHGNMSCPVDEAGLAALAGPPPHLAGGEIARFLRRHPPAAKTAPRLKKGIESVVEQLRSAGAPKPNALLDATLRGVDDARSYDADKLHVTETSVAFKAGIHAVATLKSIDGICWQSDPQLTGQLRLPNAKHLLVWRSPDKSRQAMRRDLAAWCTRPAGSHPDLIVLGGGPSGDLVDGEVIPDRRDDISAAPGPEADLAAGGSLAPREGDFTTARGLRRVAGLALAHVADVYADFEEGADAERVETLLRRIDGTFVPTVTP